MARCFAASGGFAGGGVRLYQSSMLRESSILDADVASACCTGRASQYVPVDTTHRRDSLTPRSFPVAWTLTRGGYCL